MRSRLPLIAVILLFLLGFGIFLYPEISNSLAEQAHVSAIQKLGEALDSMDPETLEKERKNAEVYNRALAGEAIRDPFVPGSGVVIPDNYEQIMDFGEGIMGELSIPKIDVDLPIYHGTEEEILKKGVGHLYQTAFPVGGEGNHTVLSGHTGLPSARLLSDLEKLEMSDCFYIRLIGETLAYQVDQILVVEPDDTLPLQPEAGKDYVTLITCTPYGVNTHRLLVRGTRIPYVESEKDEETDGIFASVSGIQSMGWEYVAGAVVSILLLIGGLMWLAHVKSKKKNRETEKKR